VQQRTPYLTDFDGARTPARHTGDFASREIGTRAASESPRVKRWIDGGENSWLLGLFPEKPEQCIHHPVSTAKYDSRRRPVIGWFRLVRRLFGPTPLEVPALRYLAVTCPKYSFVSYFLHIVCLFTKFKRCFWKICFVFGMKI